MIFCIPKNTTHNLNNYNKSESFPEHKMFRMNSRGNNYQREFGNELLNKIKLINGNDLLENINPNEQLNLNEEIA